MDDAQRPADDAPTERLPEEPTPAGGWIPPGGGYSPGAGERSGGSWGGEAPAGERPTGPSSAPRRLRRSSEDRVLGGVAGGLGRYFDVDPALFRIAFVVLLLAGGAGLLAYLGLWLITPADEHSSEGSEAGVRTLAVIGGVVLVLVALPFLLVGAVFAIPLLPLALLVLAVLLLARGARGKAEGGASDLLARVALVLLVVVVSVAAFFAAAAGAALGGGAVIAGVVVALGLGLVASAFLGGGARWLVLPAVVLAAPLGLVAASGLDLKGGMGERDYRPTDLSALRDRYKLGAGELKVDLRDLELPDGSTPLHVKVGAGHAVVYVPANVCVSSTVHVGAGYAQVLERDNGGFDVDWDNRRTAPAGVPTLALDADVGMGALEVRHSDRGGFGRRLDDGVNACAA